MSEKYLPRQVREVFFLDIPFIEPASVSLLLVPSRKSRVSCNYVKQFRLYLYEIFGYLMPGAWRLQASR